MKRKKKEKRSHCSNKGTFPYTNQQISLAHIPEKFDYAIILQKALNSFKLCSPEPVSSRTRAGMNGTSVMQVMAIFYT